MRIISLIGISLIVLPTTAMTDNNLQAGLISANGTAFSDNAEILVINRRHYGSGGTSDYAHLIYGQSASDPTPTTMGEGAIIYNYIPTKAYVDNRINSIPNHDQRITDLESKLASLVDENASKIGEIQDLSQKVDTLDRQVNRLRQYVGGLNRAIDALCYYHRNQGVCP